MDETEITQKSFYQRLRLTIALRVFYLSLVLIVLPMIFHTFWMYRRDYRQRQEELIASLDILAKSKSALLKESISDQLGLLNLISENRSFSEHVSTDIVNKYFIAYLEGITSEFGLSEILYLSPKGVCSMASDESLIGKNFYEPFLMKELGKQTFAIFGVLPSIEEKRLIVGKTIYSQTDQAPLGIFIATTTMEELLERLLSYTQAPYELNTSLLMKNGIIFTSTDPELDMRSVRFLNETFLQELKDDGQLGNLKIYQNEYRLKELPNISGGYELIGKEDSFAAQSFVKDTLISVVLDVDQRKILAIQTKKYLFAITSLVLSIILIGGGGALFLTLKMAKPLQVLQQVMKKVSEGDLTATYPYHRMGFEMNYIGKSFNQTIRALIHHQNEAEKERLSRERIAQELKIGYEIQKALLPTELVEFPGLDIATGFLPAKEVGGDFYDLFIRKDKTLFITIADTAGKGIEACLYSLGLRSALRSFASTCESLKDMIQKTNEIFYLDAKKSSMFVTLFAALYDPRTKILTYCNMGHPPPCFQRISSNLESLTTQGLALGVDSKAKIETSSIQIYPGDFLFLFTDGVIEAENKNKQFFGIDRLHSYLKTQKESSSQKTIDYLLEEVKGFCKEQAFTDDLTVVSIRF